MREGGGGRETRRRAGWEKGDGEREGTGEEEVVSENGDTKPEGLKRRRGSGVEGLTPSPRLISVMRVNSAYAV